MNKIHFKNLDVEVNNGELIGIIGALGSGKTYLLKKLCGKIKNDDIFIDNKSINEYSLDYKRKNIVSVLDYNIFNTDNVRSELCYYLEKINFDIDERLECFINYFKLDNIIDNDFIDLSVENRIFIKILSLLIIRPKLFSIDDLLTYLSTDKKNMILNYIKENNIILLCVTSNMEELLLFDKILVMDKGKKRLFDNRENVLNNEELFNELGLNLPFIYDINSLLKSYDLIDNNHIIYKELVDILWK